MKRTRFVLVSSIVISRTPAAGALAMTAISSAPLIVRPRRGPQDLITGRSFGCATAGLVTPADAARPGQLVAVERSCSNAANAGLARTSLLSSP